VDSRRYKENKMNRIIIRAKTSDPHSIMEPLYYIQLSEDGKCAVTMEEGTDRKKIQAAISSLQLQYNIADADVIEKF
jgi:hypothetical protein